MAEISEQTVNAAQSSSSMTPEQARIDALTHVPKPHAEIRHRFGETFFVAESAAAFAGLIWEELGKATNEIEIVARDPIDAYLSDVNTPHYMVYTTNSYSRAGVQTRHELPTDYATANAIIYNTLSEKNGNFTEAELVRADKLIDRAYGLDGQPADDGIRSLIEDTVREEMARTRIDEAEQSGRETAKKHVHIHHAVGDIVESVRQTGEVRGEVASRAFKILSGGIERSFNHLPGGHVVVMAAKDVWHAMNDHERVAADHVAATTDRFVGDLLGTDKFSKGRGQNSLYELRGASKTIQPSELLPRDIDFESQAKALTVRLIQCVPEIVFAPDANEALRDIAVQARVTGEIDIKQGEMSLTHPYWVSYHAALLAQQQDSSHQDRP